MKVKTILVSQPPPKTETSPYFDLSDKQKVKIDFRSFIHVEGISVKEVRGQKIDLTKATAIILTSRNAVDHFFRIAEEMRFKVPDSMKYFCQSEAVAFYLQKYVVYRKRKIYVGKRNFQDLSPLIKKYKDEKFLLPASDVTKEQIVDFLEEVNVSFPDNSDWDGQVNPKKIMDSELCSRCGTCVGLSNGKISFPEKEKKYWGVIWTRHMIWD